MAKTSGALRLELDRLSPIQATIRINSILADIAKDGYSKAAPFTIGNVEPEIKKYARENGIELGSDEIVMTTKQITHTLTTRPSKVEKGKVISPQHLAEFPVRRSSMEIYHDGKAFIYFDRSRNEKFVLHSGYELKVKNKKEKIVNYISGSKTNATEFNLPKYRRIK